MLFWKQTKLSSLETSTLELTNHIIPDQRLLVSLEWEELISITIGCYPSVQNTKWSLPTFTSNTSKSTKTFICTQDPNTGTLSTTLSSQTFWIKVMRGANCSTDHVMIKFTTKLWVRQRMSTRKLSTNKIKNKIQGWSACLGKWQASWTSNRYCRRKVEHLEINRVQGIQRETWHCSKEAWRLIWQK